MRNLITFFLSVFLIPILSFSQAKNQSVWHEDNFKGLEMRSIGPAFMSGRIADVAIHPQDDNTWFVGVASGGVWKTKNAGVTWKPIFDEQAVYAIGCVSIDPSNPNVVWVGTGENVGGRHLSFGDGVYRSEDGGHSWTNMGLKKSEHISKIIVHPTNSNIVWVASQGPLWSKGGERGLYKTVDGGKTWKQVLGDDAWTGVTDIAIDPRNPDRIYAATWDRHRTIAAYMGGGPGSGLHRSMDGGETWTKCKTGLPKSNMGKIGLAISPQQPDILYAAIELDRRAGGLYKSTDRGATWTKQSDAVSGGTGPHYYQELYACPHHFDRLYLLDVRVQISDNGGKNFRRMTEKHKHSDNHALAFRADDPDYLLVGSDGGLYESFDLAENWRFIKNLPLTQFYKVAVDDAEPFYNIYGGTQDNSSEVGPSRTDNVQGIQNSDWRVFLDWDGHQPATEPGNPNIVYGQRQQGTLARIDMTTGEVVDIQPQPAADEDYERFNWDAPILVSPHDPAQIFFASQRLWRSNNRGDSWTAISPDLTLNQRRVDLPIMGKKQSWDNAWDVVAMSNFNTITSIAESPVQRDLIMIGTDDGIIQVTDDGGSNWKKIALSSLPNVPVRSYINDIKADLFDANTFYVSLDNHKEGDYKPYLLKTTDRGATWKSIVSNLPSPNLVWRLVQDHVAKDLLFIGTEFGLYFSTNGGGQWTKLKGNVPTISFRDLAIQRRENDLVAASFGRSFYVLDDFSALRQISEQQLKEEPKLFSVRDAWWYVPRPHLSFFGQKGDQGADHYVADNPSFGAVFTYYLPKGLQTKKEQRKAKEKEMKSAEAAVPNWEVLDAEMEESKPQIWLVVKNDKGEIIRRLEAPAKKGFHRVAWDLKYPTPNVVKLVPDPAPDFGAPPSGLMATPGSYTISMAQEIDGVITPLSKPQSFEVKQLRKGALPSVPVEEVAAFWRSYEEAVRSSSAFSLSLNTTMKQLKAVQKALKESNAPAGDLDQKVHSLRKKLIALSTAMNGSPAKLAIGEKNKPTINDRLFTVSRAIGGSTYGPTDTAKKGLAIALEQLKGFSTQLSAYEQELQNLVKALLDKGAPGVEGLDVSKF